MEWTYGQGVERDDASIKHREIDPYASNRPMVNNYRLVVVGIASRPVGFVSTVSGDGKSKNLSPFSYFQVIDHDPPMFIIGFSSRPGREKDTYRNLKETGECVINSVSENMIEAVNASSIDAPYGVSKWDVSGLHEAGTTTVKPSRGQEGVFSIEAQVVDIKELKSLGGHESGWMGPPRGNTILDEGGRNELGCQPCRFRQAETCRPARWNFLRSHHFDIRTQRVSSWPVLNPASPTTALTGGGKPSCLGI